MEDTKIFVGLSINPEIVFSYDGKDDQPKRRLLSFGIALAGTSANVARVLARLGHHPCLIGMVGANGYPEDQLVRNLTPVDYEFVSLPVLEHSSVALVPDDGINESLIVGRRGVIIPSLISQAISELEKTPTGWRVLTGTLPVEYEIGKSFLGNNVGFRSFNPNRGLCQSKKELVSVLSVCDLFICNHHEYIDVLQTLQIGTVSEIHSFGPSIVIVTEEDRGGHFSNRGDTDRFDAVKFDGPAYPAGAGDWFHASFLHRCMILGKSLAHLDLSEIKEGLNFAAKVAGLKVTMRGATNGPTYEEIMNI